MRVLIVEDEPPIIRALKSMISRFDNDFEVAAAAKNGEEALELLKEQQIDVVFTDINMPVMDGLEFMEQARALYPDIFIVVISGYSNFEYAKTALVHRAFDYLLKPVSKPALSELLFRLKTAYQLKSSRDMELMLSSTINRAPSISATPEPDRRYFVMLLCAGPPTFTDDITLPGVSFWDGIDWALVADEDRSWVFQGETLPERIIIIETEESQDLKGCAESVFEAINKKDVPVTAVYYGKPAEFSDMSLILQTLKQALQRGQRLGESCLISVSQKPEPSKPALFQEALNNKEAMRASAGLSDSVIKGLPAESALAECLLLLENSKSSHAEVFRIFEYILARYAETRNISAAEIRQHVYEAVYHSLTYAELEQNMLSLLEMFGTVEKQHKTHETTEKVIEFLNENYNQPVTSDMLAKKFGFVPSYISRIFRQHTGCTPTEYITRLRMNSAKNIMRGHPELMIKEVAFMVGYKNPYHFSKTFKKEEGVWPTEYKEIRELGREGGIE